MTIGRRQTFPVVEPSEWPEGYRIAFAHEGATWAAAQLCNVVGFEPIVMQVAEAPTGGNGQQAAGEYLLLPWMQEVAWREAEKRHGRHLKAIVADLERGGGRAVERAIVAERQAAKIELLEADCHVAGEIAAFDVVVNGRLIGRWVRTTGDGGSVTWTDGRKVETGACGGKPDRIIEALRSSVPVIPASGSTGSVARSAT